MQPSPDHPYFQTENDASYEQEPLTYDQPVGQLPIVDDARWSASVTDSSWTAVAVWILMLCVLQAASWPLVKRIFRRFPDRGWAFCRLTTLLLAGYFVWLLSSLELISFRVVWCLAAVAGVAIVCFLLPRVLADARAGDTEIEAPRRPGIVDGFVVSSELVFWSVFALFLGFRLINPDSYHPSWGGEKPMEFAHINALLRSPHFPPVDPWYADGFLNYYYYGAYLVAFMLKLTGIPTEIGFNLAQPTFIALLAAGAFSVAATLGHRIARNGTLALLTGFGGVILVSFAGNFLVAARLVLSLGSDAPALSNYLYWFWIPTRVIPVTEGQRTITEFPYFTGVYADLHAHVVALPMTVLVIGLGLALALEWRALSLVVTRSGRSKRRTLRIGALLCLLALTLGSLFPTNAWDVPTYAALTAIAVFMATRGFRSLWIRLVVSAGIVAGIALLAYVLVLPFTQHYVALYGELDTVREKTPLLAIETHLGLFLLIVLFGLSALLSRRSRKESPFLDPLILTPLLGTLLVLRLVAVELSQVYRDIADALLVVFVVGVLLHACFRAMPRTTPLPLIPDLMRLLGIIVGATAIVALSTGRPVLALFLGIAGVASIAWILLPDEGERLMAAMIAGATFVGAGLEVVYLVDDLSGDQWYRMNTVFKFYNGIWILLALSCAGLAGRMVAFLDITSRPQAGAVRGDEAASDAFPTQAQTGPTLATNDVDHDAPVNWKWNAQFRNWARVGIVVTALSIGASLAFPVFSTGVRLDQQFAPGRTRWTLNAFDWMNYGTIQTRRGEVGIVSLGFDEDRAVIEWFNREVSGTPVIAEASIDAYRCGGSRISVGTGLPDVLGWLRHEQQQRYQTYLRQRQDDLRTLYTSPDPDRKRGIIDKYRVEYIVVGDLERNYLTNDCEPTDSSEGIAILAGMVGRDLDVAFTAGETIVYRVVR